MAQEDAYVLPTYEKFPFALERGEGCWVWDENGTKYLDLYGGQAFPKHEGLRISEQTNIP